jgi:hypothetical protein
MTTTFSTLLLCIICVALVLAAMGYHPTSTHSAFRLRVRLESAQKCDQVRFFLRR